MNFKFNPQFSHILFTYSTLISMFFYRWKDKGISFNDISNFNFETKRFA